ncbi:1-deoxy-D-xylulose-5-phosphate synthase [Striga asiatica]|uniref:1-deoxy-D-xylulose-5-phosphate synthase n=1 Tax=Striga asiatica TaxID=4170 RepID=A0A5A7Q4A5_STRAF|nr:1-deoxy-D-xylulose-5-phosphate synthase [Striga asiatica]
MNIQFLKETNDQNVKQKSQLLVSHANRRGTPFFLPSEKAQRLTFLPRDENEHSCPTRGYKSVRRGTTEPRFWVGSSLRTRRRVTMEMVEIGRARRFRKRSSDNERKKANLLNFYFLLKCGSRLSSQSSTEEAINESIVDYVGIGTFAFFDYSTGKLLGFALGFLSECKLKWFKYFNNFCVVFLARHMLVAIEMDKYKSLEIRRRSTSQPSYTPWRTFQDPPSPSINNLVFPGEFVSLEDVISSFPVDERKSIS